jgi:hypothetical protein
MTDTTTEAPATIVCTVELTDDGPACYWCGYWSGPGHGKKR